MKKIYSILATSLLLVSCVNEEIENVTGTEQEVLFSFSLPENVKARAIGGTSSAEGGVTNCPSSEVTFSVEISYNGNPVFASHQTVAGSVHAATFKPVLVVGETYDVVAYAQFDGEVLAADGTKLENTIVETGGINKEDEDAYFLATKMVAEPSMSGELKRHTGKLRIIANDFTEIQSQLGKQISDVKIVYASQQPTEFNPATGTWTGGLVDATFNAALASYSNEESNDAKTILVDYIPADETGHVVNFDIVVTFDDGTVFNRKIKMDVPIKRNYLTTLVGNFFTSEMELSLVIEDAFIDENEYEYE